MEIACRDPVYFAIKSSLWDLFPAWEDRFVDAAFREMLWASQGGRPQDPLQTLISGHFSNVLKLFVMLRSLLPSWLL